MPNYKTIRFLVFFSLLLLLFPPLAAPEKEEPEGFRGIKWGEHITTISGMKKISSGEGIDIYTKENETLQFCGEKVTTIEYYFYKDRFMGVYITFEGYFRFSAIKNSMFHTYGPGKKRDYFLNDYRWLKKHLLITLNYTARTNSGSVLYCYLPLWKSITPL